jgi:hypothetical protein
MNALFEFARSLTRKELWIYNGVSEELARTFYKSLGFDLLRPAKNLLLNKRWEILTSC